MNNSSLASQLVGKKIGKWNVISKRIKDEQDNSGALSSCYFIEDDNGHKGLLKAFNYVYAFGNQNGSIDVMKTLTENFSYEKIF